MCVYVCYLCTMCMQCQWTSERGVSRGGRTEHRKESGPGEAKCFREGYLIQGEIEWRWPRRMVREAWAKD